MDSSAPRSASRPRPTSRPTTPLRPSSRSSIRDSHAYGGSVYAEPAINALEPQYAELADSMADLEANFMHLQLMHESLARFSESFASFLYGLNMNAFCVDFPEAPVSESFKRVQAKARQEAFESSKAGHDTDATFMTTDTSFIDNPPTTVSSKATPKFTPPARGRGAGSTRGTTGSRYTRGGTGRARPSALPRGRGYNR
ncbi:DASH complex subunit Dam1-domain-containing protein [Talaromyces proteolyticus]|uniref:DASH complex subunit DAM1 n=1 Tax=Talaromyces proteolyticus TaxID=1131652 RepID=A0AAD4Q0Y2_9EURO|nr:DASH complex subunit Dam1-domain-containing protein [Talaromyces proteolyticus]KAH8701689.1 DASH complex subunit Dam1-domain-containing protein [Talaromyces proteolyticus]